MLVKRGVFSGACLKEMTTFQFAASEKGESEMVSLLRKVVREDAKGHFSLDKNLVCEELERRFS
jgi:hypothetical protein